MLQLKEILSVAAGLCLSATAFATTPVSKVVLQPSEKPDTVSRMIYGQFAEHLGACVYEGIWVGEDSPIPNTRVN